ncbi:hypothetical protein [Roseibium sediminicola]|uniref:Uncharacterized protein n=1 Tax=Roseibium sediminicola TaxID=2933272 RepID=A0ABT0H214_9HYPH|nr:hypothetical protein [Roseibium sp. CAU 1639]MCK7615115.1 hypothetical protein [Roseibium sp. CAU 1639]
MNIGVATFSRANEIKIGFDAYGVSYLIEEKRAEELFYVTLEAFSYLNEVELIYRGRASRSILAISIQDIISNGEFNLDKLNNVDSEVKSILELFEAGEEQCLVRGFKTRELMPDNATLENWKTVVVFNNKKNSIDDQLKCLYIGVLVSFGVDSENIGALSRLNSRELAKKIIDLEL